MEETDPYDHKVVIILYCNVNEPEFLRLAICNLPVGFSRHHHMCRGPESGISPFPPMEETPLCRENLRVCLWVKIKNKKNPSKEQVSFPLSSLVLSEAPLIYVQDAKPARGAPASQCAVDAQHASD